MNIVLLGCTIVLTCVVLAAARPSTKEHEHELLKRLSLAISKKDSTDCVDDRHSCQSWADDYGYCDSEYSEFMMQSCSLSCGLCGDVDFSTISPNLTTYAYDPTSGNPMKVVDETTVGGLTTVKGSVVAFECETSGRVGMVDSFHFMKDGVEFSEWTHDVVLRGFTDDIVVEISDSGVYSCQAVTVDGISTLVSNAITVTVVDPEPVDEADNDVVRLLEKLVEKKELNTKAKMQLKRSMELKKKTRAMQARRLHG